MRNQAAVLDIEELAKIGTQIKTCPYYGSRNNTQKADMVTLPYNMLIMGDVRRALNINLKNKIVILDEAHNVVDSVRDAYSLTISLTRVYLILCLLYFCIDNKK